MNQINDKQAHDLLLGEGFRESEISRLIQLRRDYATNKHNQTTPHPSPLLRFARWCLRIVLTDEVCTALKEDLTRRKAR